MNQQTKLALLICLICILIFNSACVRDNEGNDINLDWLRKEIIPIVSIDPAINDPSFDAILDKIGDARVVGLGEATHGTSEFWAVRQKITRYLVEKKGFNIILMEASLPGSFPLHDYIASGVGTQAEAHQKLGSWKYQEMQTFIKWMRDFNSGSAGVENTSALQFYGYDCAFSNWTEAIRLITAYLEIVDPAEKDNINNRLLKYTIADTKYVTDMFINRAAAYISNSSEKEYSIILRIVLNLIPSWEIRNRLALEKPTLEYRDSVNIINVKWILETLTKGGKVVIWAHNGHIRNGYLDDSGEKARMLGSRLREEFGSNYYPVATEFFSGHFMAWNECETGEFKFIDQNAAIPPEDSYANWFEQTGEPQFFLGLKGIDFSEYNAAWLKSPRKSRMIGATYCYYNDNQYYDNISLPEYYDGLFFIESSHPTTIISFPQPPPGYQPDEMSEERMLNLH